MIRKTAGLIAGLILSATLAAPLAATAGDPASVIRVDLASNDATQSLALPAGRSAIVDLPVDARDVLVSNPKVASAVLRTPRHILVVGEESGVTDAVFFDAAGRRILSLNIRVDPNTAILADTINRLLPGAQVKVDALNDTIILSGMVSDVSAADNAIKVAQATVSDPTKVVNMMSIAGKDQVMIKVRIVEMDREVIKQMGFNWNTILNQIGSPQFMLSSVATYGVNGALLGGLTSGFNQNTQQQPEVQVTNPVTGQTSTVVCRTCLVATPQASAGAYKGINQLTSEIQAFERVGLVRTLAEPNLTAVSGEAARFLAGGEFPIPVSQALGVTTVDYKQFGVGLGFTPVVLSSGRISLKLSTEVSDINNQGSFSSAGFTVPALTTRRAETTVELPSGGAFMIAGLLQDNVSQDVDSLPGMKDLPVLGSLFRSRDFLAKQTELVVIVSAYIVSPTSPANLQTPIDGLQIATDNDTIFLGRLNKTYKHAPQATTGKTYQGPYGYVVE